MSRSVLVLLVAGLAACGGDNGNGPSDQPQVASCDVVSYKGSSVPLSGCSMGASSFTANVTSAGVSACFNVTCSRGCLASVRLCGQ